MMRTNIILAALLFAGSVAHGQLSKTIAKMYEECKYKEVVKISGKMTDYLGQDDEKKIDDLVGRSFYMLGTYDSAVYFENKALAMDNDATYVAGWGYTFRGMALYRMGKKEESVADLEKAIKLDKNRNSVETAKEFLGEVRTNSVPDNKYDYCFTQGEYKNAIEEGRKQLQIQPYKNVMEVVGAAYYNIHYYDSAIYFERKALAADRDSTWISGWGHTYLGMALFEKGEKDKAIDELRKAIELAKTTGSTHRAENFLDAIINDRTIAIDSLHQVIKDQLNGSNYRAASNTALVSLGTNPDDVLSWDQLTTAYCLLHKYDSSLYCSEKALALDKEQSLVSCEVHFRRGIDRFMKNDKEAAEGEFTAAINDHASDNLRKKVRHTRLVMGVDNMYDDWKTVERDNIVFHFQNKRKVDDANGLMEKYEKEYNNASKVLTTPLPKKIEIFVWEYEAHIATRLENDRDESTTYTDYCLAHVAKDNFRSSEILHILGYWQKKEE